MHQVRGKKRIQRSTKCISHTTPHIACAPTPTPTTCLSRPALLLSMNGAPLSSFLDSFTIVIPAKKPYQRLCISQCASLQAAQTNVQATQKDGHHLPTHTLTPSHPLSLPHTPITPSHPLSLPHTPVTPTHPYHSLTPPVTHPQRSSLGELAQSSPGANTSPPAFDTGQGSHCSDDGLSTESCETTATRSLCSPCT